MAIIVFILFVWLFCKGLKALFKREPRIKYKPPAQTQNKVIQSLAALDALQKQREQIGNHDGGNARKDNTVYGPAFKPIWQAGKC